MVWAPDKVMMIPVADREKLKELVTKLKTRLAEALLEVFRENLLSVVLFGSYARGDFRPDSDVDVLVVLDRLPEDRLALHRELDKVEQLLEDVFSEFKSVGYFPVLSPIVLSREQASKFRPLYLDLVFDAVILYDKDSFMKNVLDKVRKKLERLGAKRVWIGRKWVVVLKEDYEFGEVIDLRLEES